MVDINPNAGTLSPAIKIAFELHLKAVAKVCPDDYYKEMLAWLRTKLTDLGVRKASELSDAAGTKLLEELVAAWPIKTEKGIRVLATPQVANAHLLTPRNLRRLVTDKSKIIDIEEIKMTEFLNLSMTDQFLLLQKYIPKGFAPADIYAWLA